MDYWSILRNCKKEKRKSYIIYTISDGYRFSYVDQYKAAFEVERKKVLQRKYLETGKYIGDLSSGEIQILKKRLEQKCVCYYQKEKWDNTNGWICTYRSKEPDDEILHHIITSEWEFVS